MGFWYDGAVGGTVPGRAGLVCVIRSPWSWRNLPAWDALLPNVLAPLLSRSARCSPRTVAGPTQSTYSADVLGGLKCVSDCITGSGRPGPMSAPGRRHGEMATNFEPSGRRWRIDNVLLWRIAFVLARHRPMRWIAACSSSSWTSMPRVLRQEGSTRWASAPSPVGVVDLDNVAFARNPAGPLELWSPHHDEPRPPGPNCASAGWPWETAEAGPEPPSTMQGPGGSSARRSPRTRACNEILADGKRTSRAAARSSDWRRRRRTEVLLRRWTARSAEALAATRLSSTW